MDPAEVSTHLPAIMATEIMPRVREYRNEMASVRDRMFGGLVKEVTHWRVPTLAVAFLTQMNLCVRPCSLRARGVARPATRGGLFSATTRNRSPSRDWIPDRPVRDESRGAPAEHP